MFERVEYIRLRSETMVLWNKDPSPLEVGETVSFQGCFDERKESVGKKTNRLGVQSQKVGSHKTNYR